MTAAQVHNLCYFFYANYNILLVSVAVSAPGDNKRCYSHDAIVMSRWHDDDRIIAVQPMVICFSWENQVSVAPKDVYRPSIFFFPHHYPLVLAVNKSPAVYSPRSTDFEEKIEGLWTGYSFVREEILARVISDLKIHLFSLRVRVSEHASLVVL